MSLILDALNRARADRGEDDGPALAMPPGAAPSPSSRRAVLALSLALGATVALLAWLAFDRLGAAPPPAAETQAAAVSEEAAAVSEEAAEAPAVPAADERAAGPAPLAPAVAALYRDRSGDEASSDEPSARGEADPGETAVAGATPVPTEKAIDVAEVLARARRELGEPALAPHPVPLIADLSQQQKDAIPTLMYLRHDYSGDGRSRVQLNGEARAVGDSVDGVSIEEILPDSVVLRHRDTLFRLRALNSWVNL